MSGIINIMFKKSLQNSIQKLSKSTRILKLLPKTEKKLENHDTIGYVGKKREEKIILHILDYNEKNFTEKDIKTIKECVPFKNGPTVTWLNISGVYDTNLIEEVGEIFGIHPLTLEDITNTTQRPKMEEYDDYIFIILKMVFFDEKTKEMSVEQVGLIIGKSYVLSFQEKPGDILESLRNKIRNSKGKIRHLGSDYLIYGIIDAIIDHYYVILEQLGEEIEFLEEDLLKNPNQKTLNSIYKLKQELVFLRKSLWPTREVIGTLQRIEHELISESIGVYLRDVYDHIIQIVDTVETLGDMTSSMLDLYLSTVSNKMNEVMKVLTMFAAIFIPLTFVVGVYGMNFDYMPELHSKLGYPIVWGVLLTIIIGLVIYFKKKKWM